MHIAKLVLLGCSCALLLPAQSEEDFHEGMEITQRAVDALKKLEPKTGKVAVSAAERLGSIYEEMIHFWRHRQSPDAVKWSQAGKAAAVQLATAAFSGDADSAAASFKELTGTCMPCHNAHRERIGPGKYRIKQ